jgi:hypothetical protein
LISECALSFRKQAKTQEEQAWPKDGTYEDQHELGRCHPAIPDQEETSPGLARTSDGIGQPQALQFCTLCVMYILPRPIPTAWMERCLL